MEGNCLNFPKTNLNLSSPYNYTPSDEGYTFTTDNNIIYIASFLDCSEYLTESSIQENINLIDFSFYPSKKSNQKLPNDARIEATIVKIVEQFLTNNPTSALLVTYDSTDGRHLARKRKFDYWYTREKTSLSVEKYNALTGSDTGSPAHNIQFIHSLFIREDNPYRYQVLTVLNDFIQIINLQK